ncbi:hypothetical protein [Nocardia sp. NPDC002869]|uniref:hypothetical protein n=1 Tax=Nocardia sp. NPDC002869 TaxID=3161032 RepID=UPI00398CCF06
MDYDPAGLHHIGLVVDDLEESAATLRETIWWPPRRNWLRGELRCGCPVATTECPPEGPSTTGIHSGK